MIGICKAYTTRVGNGPFPTEELGDDRRAPARDRRRVRRDDRPAAPLRLVRRGRSCARRRALNGLTGIALTKLDVLTGLDPLRICTAYAPTASATSACRRACGCSTRRVPEYEELPGWTEPLSDARRLEDLPANARRYVARLEELTGTPFTMISVGAGAKRRSSSARRLTQDCPSAAQRPASAPDGVADSSAYQGDTQSGSAPCGPGAGQLLATKASLRRQPP